MELKHPRISRKEKPRPSAWSRPSLTSWIINLGDIELLWHWNSRVTHWYGHTYKVINLSACWTKYLNWKATPWHLMTNAGELQTTSCRYGDCYGGLGLWSRFDYPRLPSLLVRIYNPVSNSTSNLPVLRLYLRGRTTYHQNFTEVVLSMRVKIRDFLSLLFIFDKW